MIRHVFMDLDDTILDFGWAENTALHRAYAELGIPLPDAVYARYHVVNRLWWEKLERGEVSREVLLVARHRQLFEEFGIEADPAELERHYHRNLGIGHRFLPHAEEMLAYLRPKYRLYLASNGVADTQYTRLESAGLRDFFDGVFISEELGATKPEPEYFRRCFSRIPGFDPAEAVIIGDSLSSDILGGKNAGLKTIWCNVKNRPARADILPDHEIRDLRELSALL